MNGDFLKKRIVLPALKTVGSVLLVLGGDVTGHSGNTTFLLLGALEDYLHPVSFSFLCHDSNDLNKVDESCLTGFGESGVEAVLLYFPDTLAGDFKGDVPLLRLAPELLVLEVEGEIALGTQLGMGNIVAFHSLPSGYLTNFCHGFIFLIFCFIFRGARISGICAT